MVTGDDPRSIFSINLIDYMLNKVNATAKKREYWPAGSSLWTKIRGYAGVLKECFVGLCLDLPRRNYEVQWPISASECA